MRDVQSSASRPKGHPVVMKGVPTGTGISISYSIRTLMARIVEYHRTTSTNPAWCHTIKSREGLETMFGSLQTVMSGKANSTGEDDEVLENNNHYF